MGAVNTSSPTAFFTGLPESSKVSTLEPRNLHWILPDFTGSTGQPPTNAVHTSVPPLMEASQRSSFTFLYTHSKRSEERGEPVDPTPRSFFRSYLSFGLTPALEDDEMNAALVPK